MWLKLITSPRIETKSKERSSGAKENGKWTKMNKRREKLMIEEHFNHIKNGIYAKKSRILINDSCFKTLNSDFTKCHFTDFGKD